MTPEQRAAVLTDKPRIYFSDTSGHYWCISKHDTPQQITPLGTKVFHRVGMGDTPEQACQSWKEW